jgi:DNA polymerase-3 subunit delta'
MGPRQIFIIAEAEALAPQASSSEAANALLKLLEEPPEGTTIVLTSAEPGRLLPTIRSRTTQLHVPPLSHREVLDFLKAEAGVEEAEAIRAAGHSKGAIGRALGFLKDDDGPGPLAQTRSEALGLLAAALSSKPGPRIRASLEFKSVGARGLGDLFDFLEECLGDLARAASGLPVEGCTDEEAAFFAEAASRNRIHPATLPRAVARVHQARVMAAGNVNPQLIIFGLLHDLQAELDTSGSSPHPGDAG